MKVGSLFALVLVAVASSVSTALLLELVRREARPAAVESTVPAPRADSAEPPARPPARLEPIAPVAPDRAADLEARLAAIEERLGALERSPRASREPVAPGGAIPDEAHALRQQVLEWVAEDREARRIEAERDEEEERRKEHEFDVRVHAHAVALEHELSAWQEEKLVEVLLEVEAKRAELEQGIDPLTAVPEDVERLLTEFEAWARRRVEEELGYEVATELFGEG